MSAPLIIQIEAAITKAEFFLRQSSYDLLEELYDNSFTLMQKQVLYTE